MKLNRDSAVKLVVTAAFLALLVLAVSRFGDLGEARDTLSRASPGAVFLAFVVHAAMISYYSLRWRAVLQRLGLCVSVPAALRIHFAAVFVGNVTPSRVGELVKVSIYRETVDRSASVGTVVTSVLVDRLGDLTSVGALSIALSLVLYAWSGDGRLLYIVIWCTGVAALAILIWGVVKGWHIAFADRLEEWGLSVPPRFTEYADELHHSGGTGGAVRVAVVMGALGYLLSALKNLLLVQSVGGTLTYLQVFAVTPIVASAALVPFTFGGIGALETGYFVLFTIMGLSVEAAVAVAVLNRVVSLVAVYGLGGLAALSSGLEAFGR